VFTFSLPNIQWNMNGWILAQALEVTQKVTSGGSNKTNP
jgi:hypothetical protein